jgi:hypothetical protein
MNMPTIQPISSYNQFSTKFVNTGLSDKFANSMPNGLTKVSEPQNNKNINNNIRNTDLRQIYTAKLAPSAGSTTENFLKSRSNLSPVYKFNEAATKYEMTSVAPIFLKQLKKNVDLVI